jgi:hypothetical protein
MNTFKGAHLEFKKGTQEYKDGGRKKPKQDPKTALRIGIAKSCLKVKSKDAKEISNLISATAAVVETGLKNSDKRLKTSDSRKFMTGTMMSMGSPNKKVQKRGFNGMATKRPRDDTP